MTLFKQLALLVSLMFLLLTSVIIVGDFQRSGQFLQGQMQTTAQDMATTLGIAISNLPSADDPATLEVLFNSVFDSGYYSSIRLASVEGAVIHQKNQQIALEGVPDWFVSLVPLQSAQGSTQVMQGWTQLGQLSLSLHPGYAYSGLYAALVSTINWSLFILLSAVMILWLLLNYLLSPLRLVRKQADSIHKNRFVMQKKIPATLELRSVVVAMNEMVAKVQSVFNDQQETLSRYQQLLYNDKVTGLGNRRYMLDHLQQSLAEESSFHGCLAVIKLVNLEQLHERHGYELSEKLIKQMAALITQKHAELNAEKTARLAEDEFAFLIAADEDSVIEFIKSVYRGYKKIDGLADFSEELYPVAAVSALEQNQSVGDLLSGIDYCLTRAISAGPFAIEQRVSTSLDLPKGKMQWRAWLDDVLSSERLFLVGQAALDHNKLVVHKELFIRARNSQQQVIPASAFMPMASGLGMAIEIDKAVFKLINNSSLLASDIPLAVNLSSAFFERAEGQEEFDQMLSDCREQGIQLCVEASHHILLQHPAMCSQVSERVKKYKHQFGVDNLDLGQSLQLLQTAQFDYVKINANVLSSISSDEMASAYQALKTLTSTLGIQVIAVAVDSQALFDQLGSLGIQVMQGNFLNVPDILHGHAE